MIKLRVIYLSFLLICSLVISSCNQSQSNKNEKIATFKVWGNCEMCKKTIDNSLIEGVDVFARNWDQETKIMKVSFDSTIIDLPEIHKKIAESGYDTELEIGTNEAYGKLPECCKYTRKNEE